MTVASIITPVILSTVGESRKMSMDCGKECVCQCNVNYEPKTYLATDGKHRCVRCNHVK